MRDDPKPPNRGPSFDDGGICSPVVDTDVVDLGGATGQTGQGHSEHEHSSSTSHGGVTTRHCPRFPRGSEKVLGSRRTAADHQR
jgi:hypothetical protein